MWLPDDNREEEGGEAVLKEEQVINDFSCIILEFVFRYRPLCPVQKIMAVNFFREVVCLWVRGASSQKAAPIHIQQQKAQLIKEARKKE